MLPSCQPTDGDDWSLSQAQLRQGPEPAGLEISVGINMDGAGNLPIDIRGRPDIDNRDRPACSEQPLEFADRDAVSCHVLPDRRG